MKGRERFSRCIACRVKYGMTMRFRKVVDYLRRDNQRVMRDISLKRDIED